MRAEQIEFDWNPKYSIYASPEFLRTVGDDYGWLGGVDNSECLRCILPYTIVKKGVFELVRFRMETIPMDDSFTVDEEEEFLNVAVDFFKGMGAHMIIPATTNTIFKAFPKGAIAAPYGTYKIDLTLPEDDLWSNLHAKHRNVIRRAMKDGVEIRSGKEFIESAHGMIEETLGRSKMKFMQLQQFIKFIENLGQNVKIMVALKGEEMQGCAIIPYSLYSAYYLYGGSAARPATGANNLMHWEALKLFKEFGVKWYDFVGVRIQPEKGSKQAGLELFKKRFGATLEQGYMWKLPLKSLHYKLYSAAVRMIRGGDIVDSEKHKLVGIPGGEMQPT